MNIIHTSDSFDIEFVMADEKRNTGGALKIINGGWIKNRNSEDGGDVSKKSEGSKARNHYHNKTRTIHRKDGHPVDVHIYLITKINRKEVTLA